MHDKWNLTNIPKIAHFYWGGQTMPYLRYLTLKSFAFYNPDWEIRLYTPERTTKEMTWDTFEQKYSLGCDDFTIKAFTEFKATRIINPWDTETGLSDVHRSDFLRWDLLYKDGGLWADMDILFIKPMSESLLNRVDMDSDVYNCVCHYGHSIGFLMAAPGNDYYKLVSERAKTAFRKEDYQCIGANLCNSIKPTEYKSKSTNIPMDTVYAYDAHHIPEMYETSPVERLTDYTIGIHWYAGHPLSGEFLERTNGGLVKEDTFLSRMIKQFEDEAGIH